MVPLCLLAAALVVVPATATSTTPACPEGCTCSRYLHYVNCVEASLTEVPRLPVTTKVIRINLAKNEIAALEDRVFHDHNIVNISVVNLYANNITAVDANTFSGSDEHLLSLTLGANLHIQLPEHGFDLVSLHYLDLSYCNLDRISATFFQTMPAIENLMLFGNHLSYFDPNIVAPGRGLELMTLSLSHNNFTRLDLKLMEYQTSDLKIHGNPFHCDCAFRQAFAVFVRHADKNLPPLTCHSPPSLKGKGGDRLLKMSLQCEAGELVASLQGRSFWYIHQWWILTLCAMTLVLIATLVYLLHRNYRTPDLVQWLWNSMKRTFQDQH